jgi:L-2-hydroxyglutarate oxidase
MLPKIAESSRTGAKKAVFDRQFISLASSEIVSSLSKRAMIARAREFLPALRASAFTKRGTSGIRSSLIDRHGKFVPDTIVKWADSSVHILNYNSPGATGALAVAAKLAGEILERGALAQATKPRSMWDATSIAAQMQE